jgi:hypothetical protein
MQQGKFKSGVFFAGLAFFAWANAPAQQIQPRSQRPAGSAEGTLAVTATVVSSTGLVIGPGGQQRIIVANAADPRDNAPPSLQVKVVALAPVSDQKPDAAPPQEKQQKKP